MSLLKHKMRRARFLFRLASSSLRSLPDFIVIGAQKSGTTSLFSYLAQHPGIIPSFTKEVHFFDGGKDPGVDTYARGERWYRAHFPVKSGRAAVTGEASPLYMFNPLAARRIHSLVPGVRLMALLRDPVERAVSHYYHEKRKGREPLPMLEAFEAEKLRLEPALSSSNFKDLSFINHSYLSRGLYAEQLKRYLGLFHKQQVLVLCSEEFFTHPDQTLARVCTFLEVDPGYRFADLKPRNTGKNKKPVDPGVRSFLQEYFHEANRRLFRLLGREFKWS